jgi:hypothetical protein
MRRFAVPALLLLLLMPRVGEAAAGEVRSLSRAGQLNVPPPPGEQLACIVWWEAPRHLGAEATVCGTPEGAIEHDGLLILFLGPTPHDLRLGLPLDLRADCPEQFDALAHAPSLTRLRATGELVAKPDGPLLEVRACEQLSVEPSRF